MKKLLILLLAISMVVCLAACGGDTEESSAPANSSSASSTATSSASTSSKDTSSTNVSSADSSSVETEAVSSDDPSETSGELPDGLKIAEGISQFVGWSGGSVANGTPLQNAKAGDATSLQLTAINESPVDGTASVIAFNYDYGRTIESEDGSYDDYNILVFTYNHSIFGYTLSNSLGVDDADKDDVAIPDDGFVVAVHKHWQAKVDAIKALDAKTVIYPHGFRATDALDANITSGTATVDGKVSEAEYGKPIWEIEPYFELANYEQFESPLEVDVTAKVYVKYDSKNLYIGVVVDSPNHYLPNKDSLWRYDSIQVNIISVDPMGEYISGSNYWNFGSNAGSTTQSSADNVFRQYGFGVTDAGESIACLYMGKAACTATTVCYRDDANQTTTYEAAIPFSECGKEGETIKGEKGTVIGFSVSVNQGNKDTWQNVALRDGGGIIGLNDLSKVPTIKFN